MVTEEEMDRVADVVEEKLEYGGQELTNEELEVFVDNSTVAPAAHKEYSEQAETVATAIREGDMDSALSQAISFRDKVQDSSNCPACEELANNLLEDVAVAMSCALAGGECLEEKETALKQAENVRDIFAPEPEAELQ